jgi:hypothetical protein
MKFILYIATLELLQVADKQIIKNHETGYQ